MKTRRSLPCAVLGCTLKRHGRGWCDMHHTRWLRHGHPEKITRSPNGAGTLDDQGYLRVKVKGHTTGKHRLVWEAVNGPIPLGYDIHHINGIKTDNRIENLQPLTPTEHARLHLTKYTGCSVDGCGNPHDSRSYCSTHYRQMRTWNEIRPIRPCIKNRKCSVGGCYERHIASGYCNKHYKQIRIWGEIRN